MGLNPIDWLSSMNYMRGRPLGYPQAEWDEPRQSAEQANERLGVVLRDLLK